jgi:mannose-1-phosphate guanylyltransferase/mannose-1-phosphate guanylyltransferase/mannose-6-phosphate isomerase
MLVPLDAPPITPVILAGGSGTRLWPLSREQFPKQLLALHGDRTMIQETLLRFGDAERFAPAIVVTSEVLRFSVAQQLLASGGRVGALVLEPVARNTAPAVAAAAMMALENDPEACLLVVPSDHVIADVEAFLGLMKAGQRAARAGFLVTFGITPDRAETGYGYIRRGAPLPGHDGVLAVDSFVEKPDAAKAAQLLADGQHLWNAGIFLFSAAAFLTELAIHAPQVGPAVAQALARRTVDHDFIRLDAAAFAAAPSISVDYAVMEKTARAATIPADIGWSDLGAWSELWNIADKDAAGNAIKGDVLALDSQNCLLIGDDRLTVALGLRDLAVVVTGDAVLVADRERSQDIKLVVDRLKQAGRSEAVSPSQVSRPWGSFRSILVGERFQVKCLSVNPGARLSLQKHFHRAEHWVVVNGTALVTCGDEQKLLGENESFYIPIGSLHRLENPGKLPLNLIEVQTGPYLGEDDIVRVDDPWGRG